MDLKNWLKSYLKYKDTIQQTLKIIEENGDELVAVHLEDKKKYLVKEELSASDLKVLDKYDGVCSVNTKKNFDILSDNWESFAKHPKLTVILVNEDENDKLIIRPFIHNRISDQESLKQGLKAIRDASLGKIKDPKK